MKIMKIAGWQQRHKKYALHIKGVLPDDGEMKPIEGILEVGEDCPEAWAYYQTIGEAVVLDDLEVAIDAAQDLLEQNARHKLHKPMVAQFGEEFVPEAITLIEIRPITVGAYLPTDV